MRYQHTQHAPLYWVLLAVATIQGVCAALAWDEPTVGILLAVSAAIVLLLAFMFKSLTIEDGGDALVVHYGPLPLFGTRIAYADITAVEAGQSAWIDGWGIHFIPGRGWTLNLWGFDCVELHLGDRVMRVGSDDVENLVAFLRERIGEKAESGKQQEARSN